MSKKTDIKKSSEYMDKYRENIRKLQVLSNLSTQQFLGSLTDVDPRKQYMLGLETFKNLANVYFEVIAEILLMKLGVPKEDYLQLMDESLNKQIKAMEQDLCVTNWDKQGNPIFDLPRYSERVKTWPV